MASSSFYLKNAAVGLLVIVPLVLALVVLSALHESATSTARELTERNDSLTDVTRHLGSRLAGAEDTLQRVRRTADSALRRLDQPPLIVLTEADGFTFPSGKADISAAFASQIDQLIVSRVLQEAAKCNCDVVEVIGHTDGQLVTTRSNLDGQLGYAIYFGTALSPGSNADLGLMRAWAVADRLRRNPTIAHLKYYAYSAAQMIEPSGAYAPPDDIADRPERRRIEIRLRRSR